jgi:hypothetical protein
MSERGDKEAVVDTPGKGAAVEEDLSVRMESVKVVKTVVLIFATVKWGNVVTFVHQTLSYLFQDSIAL